MLVLQLSEKLVLLRLVRLYKCRVIAAVVEFFFFEGSDAHVTIDGFIGGVLIGIRKSGKTGMAFEVQ